MILLVGNWKMSPDKNTQVVDLVKKTTLIARGAKKSVTTVVCPPFIHLTTAIKNAKTPLLVGAQSVSQTLTVASTGLINAPMLKDAGVSYCIVGHSESRARGETNEMVKEQTLRLIEKKITPIVCIGEKNRDAHGWYLSEVKDQIDAILNAVPKAALKNIVIAYEPIWAIGAAADREATPAECHEMVIYIRKFFADMYGDKFAASVVILYGGSVNEQNATSFIVEGKVQGLLVGRVSVDPKRFGALVKALINIEA